MWKMHETPQQLHDFSASPKNLHAMSFRSLLHMATKTFSGIVPLHTFFALAFTMVNLLLLCNLNFTSSMLLSWLLFGYQTGMQVFYITPALCFWFIVLSSVFQLFSFLDRFSLIPLMFTKFHQKQQAWILTEFQSKRNLSNPSPNG